jgi:calcineurin-like phosphoesterase family protein
MNSTIIKNWNGVISSNDTVFVLGDMFFKINKELIIQIMNSLNGKKVLIIGNHDNRSPSFYMEVGFSNAYYYPILYKEKYIFSHYPLENTHGLINIHGHIHEKTIGDRFHINVSVEQLNYTPVLIDSIK